MNEAEKAEFEILSLCNPNGKFAIALGGGLKTVEAQAALERLQLRRWITLIDISPLAEASQPRQAFRVFLASEDAMAWFRANGGTPS